MWLCRLPSTVYCRDSPFSAVSTWLPGPKWAVHVSLSWALGSQLFCMGLHACFGAQTVPFRYLALRPLCWNQKLWHVLLCSFSWGFLCLVRVSCCWLETLGFSLLLCGKYCCNFDWDCMESRDSLLRYEPFKCVNPSIPRSLDIFFFLVSSWVSFPKGLLVFELT